MHATPLIDPQLLARFEGDGLYQRTTLWDLVAGHPDDSVAVVCPRHGEVTMGTLRTEAAGLAAAWHAEGVQPGEVIVLQLPNWYDFVLAHLALTRLGAVTLALLPTYRRKELAFILDAAGATGIVVAPGQAGCPDRALYDDLLASLDGLRHCWDVTGAPDLRALAATGDPDALPAPPDPDEVTIVMATSGTTGDPKLLMHTHRSTVGGVLQAVAAGMGIDQDDVLFMPSPIAHATGLQYGARMALVVGAPLVLQQRWQAAEAAEIIERHRATWIMGATPFLYDLLELDPAARPRLATLRRFVCGGAPLPESLAAQATEQLPEVSLLNAWGMSETGIATMRHHDDPLEKAVSSDGRPVAGWEVRIASEDGTEVPVGEEGEIQCRGAALFVGYLGRPELTAEAVPDGWMRTGDLGRIDADGFVRCLGRTKDLLIRGGLNISATEVENLVRQHPAIVEAAVVGAPDPRLGDRICAFVVLAPGATAPEVPELGEHLLAQGLAKWKLPERIVAVDALPMTPTGKVQKHVLRARLSDESQPA